MASTSRRILASSFDVAPAPSPSRESKTTRWGTRQQDASLVAFELNMDIVDTRRHAGCGKEGLRNLPAALADQGLERLTDQFFWIDTQKGERCGIRLDDL